MQVRTTGTKQRQRIHSVDKTTHPSLIRIALWECPQAQSRQKTLWCYVLSSFLIPRPAQWPLRQELVAGVGFCQSCASLGWKEQDRERTWCLMRPDAPFTLPFHTLRINWHNCSDWLGDWGSLLKSPQKTSSEVPPIVSLWFHSYYPNILIQSMERP